MNLKIIFFILSIAMYNIILDMDYFKIEDLHWDEKICQPIEDGYEYNNIVIDHLGVTPNSPPIRCWYTEWYGKFEVSLDQPLTYGFMTRIIIGILAGINMYVIFECYNIKL